MPGARTVSAATVVLAVERQGRITRVVLPTDVDAEARQVSAPTRGFRHLVPRHIHRMCRDASTLCLVPRLPQGMLCDPTQEPVTITIVTMHKRRGDCVYVL